jgi:ribosome-associated protein
MYVVQLCTLVCLAHFIDKGWAYVPGMGLGGFVSSCSALAATPKGTPPRVKRPTKRDRQLADIFDNLNYERGEGGSFESKIKLEDDEELPVVLTAVKAADMRKGGNIKAMRISHMTEVTTFMVIVEGNSKPQNQAIANAIKDSMWESHYREAINNDGDATSGWMVMDYGSLIIHIMTPKMREFYKIERRWKNSEEVDLSQVLLVDPSAQSNSILESDEEEIDPFWS